MLLYPQLSGIQVTEGTHDLMADVLTDVRPSWEVSGSRVDTIADPPEHDSILSQPDKLILKDLCPRVEPAKE